MHSVLSIHSLSEHECQYPDENDNRNPYSQSDNAVTVGMSGAGTQDSPKEELSGNIGVDRSDNDSRYEDESESGFTRIWLE